MRGKLRDKRDVKRDRTKREMTGGRKSGRKDNRNLQFMQPFDDDDDDLLEEEDLAITEDPQQ
jgi:hypothetical protein